MIISIGSENSTKKRAVQNVFSKATIQAVHVPSHVAAQPFSDAETKEGAINRALGALKHTSASVGIGLEGGVMYIGTDLYLCNWGALATSEEEVYTASGARIFLPNSIKNQLEDGIELGDIMDEYANQTGVRNKEGAIGVFTNNLVSRSEMFTHVTTLLSGQWEYWTQKNM